MNRATKEMVKKFGLDGLPSEQQEALMVALGDTILQAVVIHGLEMLTENQKDALDAALKPDPENIDIMMDFLESNLPDFEKIVSEESQRIVERATNLSK